MRNNKHRHRRRLALSGRGSGGGGGVGTAAAIDVVFSCTKALCEWFGCIGCYCVIGSRIAKQSVGAERVLVVLE